MTATKLLPPARTKPCTKCGADFDETNWYTYSSGRGWMSWCKSCHNTHVVAAWRRRQFARVMGKAVGA